MPYIGNQPFGKTVRNITSETLTTVKTLYYPTGGYTVGYVDVYLNGVRLTETADFTATDGSLVTLLFNPLIGDTVDIVSYGSVELANAVRRSGDTLVGTLNTQALVPTANVTYDIGTSTMRYRDIYLSGNTINLGDVTLTANATSFRVANTTGGTFPSSLANTTITGTLTSNGEVTIANSTSNVAFFAANGSVGVGTASPSSRFHASSDALGADVGRFHATNASYNDYILFPLATRNTSNNSYYFFRCRVSGVSDRLLIADSGAISTAGSIQIGDAGAPPTSGIGIKFPATQSASSDANTLDDYEEGTWTPTDTSGAGLSLTINGTSVYTKIGRMVYATANITYPSTSNGLNAAIGGLPFATSNYSSATGGGFGATINYTNYTATHITMLLQDSSTNALPHGAAALSNASLSTRVIRYTAIYQVA